MNTFPTPTKTAKPPSAIFSTRNSSSNLTNNNATNNNNNHSTNSKSKSDSVVPNARSQSRKSVQFSGGIIHAPPDGDASGSDDAIIMDDDNEDYEGYVNPYGRTASSPINAFVRRRSASISAAAGTTMNGSSAFNQRKSSMKRMEPMAEKESGRPLSDLGEVEEEEEVETYSNRQQMRMQLNQKQQQQQQQRQQNQEHQLHDQHHHPGPKMRDSDKFDQLVPVNLNDSATSSSSSLSTVSTVSSEGAVARYEVLEPWFPQRFDELALSPGDFVVVTKVYEDGWCDGRLETSDEEGVFPMACLKGRAWSFFGMIEGGLMPEDVGIDDEDEGVSEGRGEEKKEGANSMLGNDSELGLAGAGQDGGNEIEMAGKGQILNMSSVESAENLDDAVGEESSRA
jgi:hypothetical protein